MKIIICSDNPGIVYYLPWTFYWEVDTEHATMTAVSIWKISQSLLSAGCSAQTQLIANVTSTDDCKVNLHDRAVLAIDWLEDWSA